MKRKVVYALERGEYSDYRVLALFENRADAQSAAKRTAHYEGAEVVAREVYQSDPAPTPYYVIEQMDKQPATEMLTWIIEDWNGPHWEGRMIRGVAFMKWPYGVRVWGTNKEGVRRRWQEYTQQREAEEAGL